MAWLNREPMKAFLESKIQPIFRRFGFEIVRFPRLYRDLDPATVEIYERVREFTMTSPERIFALVDAVNYVVEGRVKGAMVECGVWRGGSAMAMALALRAKGATDRDIFLYDTFSGMSAPSEEDRTVSGTPAKVELTRASVVRKAPGWLYSPIEEVRENVYTTQYPVDRLHFVQGKVEETIPATIPENIALLRLDTDWYESTKHELTHLFPRVVRNGVIIVDDYGYWRGARKAVDEYIQEHGLTILLNRIDHTGRIGIKVG